MVFSEVDDHAFAVFELPDIPGGLSSERLATVTSLRMPFSSLFLKAIALAIAALVWASDYILGG